MARTAEEKKRLGRLAGTEEGGGGLQLPSLFQAILNELQDNGSADDARVTELTEQTLGGQSARVKEAWGDGSWGALAADAMAQMEHVRVVERDGSGNWVTGPEFRLREFLEIIPRWHGQPPDGTRVFPKQEREERNAAEHVLREYEALAHRASHQGLRNVTEARLSLIRESIETVGDLRKYFPVLEDTEGNVIDGHHRRTIDPSWPAASPKVQPDDRVAVALAANQSNAWSKKEWKELHEKAELAHGKAEATRVMIRLRLLEDAARSDRTIANLVSCYHTTVAPVRAELQLSGGIHHYKFAGGRGNKAELVHEACEGCCEGLDLSVPPEAQPETPPPAPHRKMDDPDLLNRVKWYILTGSPTLAVIAEEFGIAPSTLGIVVRTERAAQAAAAAAREDPVSETQAEEALETAEPEHQHRWGCLDCGVPLPDSGEPGA